MPVQFQTAWFPFSSGVDSKVDALVLEPPYLQVCENAVFLKQGSIQKRYGYNKVTDTPDEIIQLNDVNDILYAQTPDKTYLYSPTVQSFYEMGDKLQYTFQHKEVARKNYQHYDSTAIDAGTFTVVTWTANTTGSNSQIRYSVFDATETPIISDKLIANEGYSPHLLDTQNYIWITYRDDSNQIVAVRIPKNNPSVTLTPIVIVDEVYDSYCFDCSTVGELNAFVVAYEDGYSGITCKYINDKGEEGLGLAINGLPTSAQITGTQPTSSSYTPFIHIFPGVTSSLNFNYLVTYSNGSDAYGVISDFSFSTTATDFLIDSANNISNIAGVFCNDNWYLLTEVRDSYLYTMENRIDRYQIDLLGNIVSYQDRYALGVTLGSQATLADNETDFIFWGLCESDIQPTYFLYKDIGTNNPKLIGKHLPGYAGTKNSYGFLSNNATTAAINTRNTISTNEGTVYTNNGVAVVKVIENSNIRQNIVGVGNVALLVGTLPQLIDGRNCLPLGFHAFPEDLEYLSDTTGNIEDGTYLYCVTFSWTDNNGDTHESAPSIPISITTSGGPKGVILRVSPYRFCDLNNDTFNTDIIINLYRTLNTGTVFYKVNSSSSNFIYNAPADYEIYLTDDVSDSSLSGNPQLYTAGGVLENIAPQYCEVATQYQNRMFLAGVPSEPCTVFFSQPYQPGVGLQFNELLQFKVKEGEGGPITALGTLDNSLIIFKRKNIYTVSGLGPDFTGLQSDFNPSEIATDVGCIYPESIITTPLGLIFKSSKGIYQLDRQLQVSYIGKPVEQYNESSIYQATIVPEENHIKFILSSGEILYYNYLYQIWSIFTNYNATAGTFSPSNGKFYHCTSDNQLFQQTTDFKDNGAPYKFRIKTAWINFNNKLSIKRVKKAALLGERVDDAKITWKIYHDYRTYPTETIRFNVTSGDSLYGQNPQWGNSSFYGTDDGGFGEELYFGSGSFYGGSNDGTMIYSHQIKQQKCMAICFELYDDTVSNQTGPGFNLVGFELEFGYKAGLKFKQSRRV